MVSHYDVEAERNVLSAILMDNEAGEKVFDILKPDDFYSKDNKNIYDAMMRLHDDGKAITLITLHDIMMDFPNDYIKELCQDYITSQGIIEHAQIVHNKATERLLMELMDESQKRFMNEINVSEDISLFKEKLKDLESERILQKDFVSAEDICLNVIQQIEEIQRNGGISGIQSGFTDLDRLLSGFHEQELILVAARPAMGKTAFTLNIANKIAVRDNKCVVFFSLEMSKEQLIQRMASSESLVDAQKIRNGDLMAEDWDKLLSGMKRIGNSQIIIDDMSFTLSDIRRQAKIYKEKYNAELIMIDYLQLMSSGKSENRNQEISEISRGLKLLAKELNVPIICLSQLSRAVESRSDHKPMLSDLRESGAIEQDADVVMFLYRDEYYNPDTEKKGVGEVIVAKHRSGPTGTIELVWLGQYTKFVNMEYTQNPFTQK